jgi:3-hydroxyacyl-CoA dehydrogenase
VIPTPDTDPEIVAFTSEFCDRRLGKGVVECKDTPNFIGNRIGCFWGATIYKYAAEGSYTIEEVDALTGSLIGLPNSASFRLIDIVGLDVWAHVGRNLFDLVPADPWRDRFLPPPFVDEMLRRKWLGEKTGSGFYRRTGPEKTIEALDLETFEYRPARKVSFESVETARNIEFLPDRLRKLVTSEDRAGSFLWEVCRDAVLYAAERIPEISGRIVEVDRAMRWGYAHTYGPFELWDALGFAETANRIEADGFALPEWVAKMRAGGASGFYSSERGSTSYFDLAGASYRTLEARPGITVLTDLRQAGKVVKANPGASLIDLGDGVLCLEFHTKLNTLGEDIFSMIHTAADETERNWQALVVGNQGGDFCVGANLKMVLLAAQQGKWDEIDAAVANFQRGVMRLKYLPRPVVAAPFGRTLGGGAEITLHAARVQASAELYMGLVEAGVGLIPAGGGCKEAILRWKDPRRAFEAIGMARVSSSAEDARDIGYLSAADRISMNQERLVEDAKQLALSLARDWTPAVPVGVPVTGEAGYALMKMGAWMAHQGGYISEYDLVIAEKLARVASGGRITGEQVVGEKYLLDLEREAFLSLCGDERTQARMQHMLKTGKALRN